MNRKLRSFHRKRGVDPEEIARAEREDRLLLLAFDYQLMPGRPRYTFAEACRRASFDVETAKRLWRALGFPDAPPEERLFRDDDVETIITMRRQIDSTIVPVGENYEELVQIVRVVAGSLAKIAEVESDALATAVRERRLEGVPDEEIAMQLTDSLDWSRLSRLIDYALRLQLRASARRKLTATDPQAIGAEDLAVGFVDLVGYTALSQELEPEELGALVGRFEELAYDTVAEHGGRVVKTIGDEVMFVAADNADAALTALRLTERSAVDELLPEARAGLAGGAVLAQEGDYYGPVVNLASRLVELARPGSVLVSDVLHRRRGGRHPQPRGRHTRRPGQPRRGAHGRAARQCRRDRVLVTAPPRLPRLGHARHRDQRPARQLRQRAARRGGRTVGRDHPGRAAAGHRHVRRRPRVLSAPRPHPGARDLGARLRRRRRPRSLPRGGRAVAAVEDVLLGLVEASGAGAARGVHRARTREPLRALVRGRVPRRRRSVHDPRRRRRVPRTAPGRAPRAPHAGRPGRLLDEAARRGDPGHVPVGGVRAGALAGRRRGARRRDGRARNRLVRRRWGPGGDPPLGGRHEYVGDL